MGQWHIPALQGDGLYDPQGTFELYDFMSLLFYLLRPKLCISMLIFIKLLNGTLSSYRSLLHMTVSALSCFRCSSTSPILVIPFKINSNLNDMSNPLITTFLLAFFYWHHTNPPLSPAVWNVNMLYVYPSACLTQYFQLKVKTE